ncbi:hypothetical protein FOVSG1_000734 [Fusarium oxysporum f. sp. vasinfectum]
MEGTPWPATTNSVQYSPFSFVQVWLANELGTESPASPTPQPVQSSTPVSFVATALDIFVCPNQSSQQGPFMNGHPFSFTLIRQPESSICALDILEIPSLFRFYSFLKIFTAYILF